MRKTPLFAGCAILAVAALSPVPTASAAMQAGGGQVDPDAIAALDRMGASLRAMQSFRLVADVSNEQVLTTGQKLQFGGKLDVRARRPNAFRMDIESDRESRSIYYDGKAITVVAPRLGYYASTAAPGTIAETLKLANERHGLELPLADLFTWGTPADNRAAITSAFRVGTETIRGADCEHYAVRQPMVDWQIWIREGAAALPCKLVITTTDDPSMPQYVALFDWKSGERFAERDFTFVPPSGARKITLGVAN